MRIRRARHGTVGHSLAHSHASFETPCGAYGHFKITRYLLRVTKNAQYGDSMERCFYNTILGAWPIQPDGTSFYYSDYAGHRQEGLVSGQVAVFAQEHSRNSRRTTTSVPICVRRRCVVNLFTPSRCNGRMGRELWPEARNQISVRQTGFKSRCRVPSLRNTRSMSASPGWAAPDPVLSVNGKRVSEPTPAGHLCSHPAHMKDWRSG